MLRLWACNTITGQKLAVVPFESGNFRRRFQDSSGSFTILPEKMGLPVSEVRKIFDSTNTTLVVETPGDDARRPTVLYAGIIWKMTPSGRSVTFETEDIWSLLRKRLALDVTASKLMEVREGWSNRNFESLVWWVLRKATTGNADENRDLPFYMNAGAEGTRSILHYGYHLPLASEALSNLIAGWDGPEVELMPRWQTGNLMWQPRVGEPRLTGPQLDFTVNAPGSPLTDVTETVDANNLVSKSIVVGEGTEKNTKYSSVRTRNPAYPATDVIRSEKQESNQDKLLAIARQELKNAKPITQWAAKLQAFPDDPKVPGAGDIVLGQTMTMLFSDHWWTPNQKTATRVIGFDSDMGTDVTLQLQ